MADDEDSRRKRGRPGPKTALGDVLADLRVRRFARLVVARWRAAAILAKAGRNDARVFLVWQATAISGQSIRSPARQHAAARLQHWIGRAGDQMVIQAFDVTQQVKRRRLPPVALP